MESSETRAARLGAERCRDRALEERGVAPGKKNAARLGAHIVFADESGFLLIPTVVRTWAPQGETPIHRHRQGRRDKLSVISGISVSPKRRRLSLYYLLFFENIGQEEVCVFLRELLRHLRGPIIVLLDNSSTHKGEPLEKLRARHPRSEEHTSELQSQSNLVCRLLLEKKKKQKQLCHSSITVGSIVTPAILITQRPLRSVRARSDR